MRQIREMMALALLAVCSYTDIKEKSIYLVPLVICVSGAAALSVTSFVFASDTGVQILLHELLIPAVAGILLIIAVKAGKAYIGAGDGYLLAALWLVLGLADGVVILMSALIFSFLFSIFIIISGKRGSYRLIPFAPFVLLGFVALLINTIY